MNLKIKSILEAAALFEAVEDRLEKDIDDQERDRLELLRSRIETLIAEEK